jgi:hypothetical protein
MSQSISPQNPIQPLSVGNVVSAAFRLYGSHLKQYFGIALLSMLWLLLPFIGIVLLSFGISAIAIATGEPAVAFLLGAALALAAIAVMIYSITKTFLNSALIARLAFRELINQPEGTKEARNQLNSHFWSFLFVNLIMFLIAIGFLVLNTIADTILRGGNQDNRIGSILFGLFSIASFVVQTWISCRLYIYEIPLAVEGVSSGKSVARSWDLTKGNVVRILLIGLVSLLVTLPIFILLIFIFAIVATLAFQASSPFSNAPSFLLSPFLPLLILGAYGLLLLGFLSTLPFYQAIKAVVYYDLRSRREGLGLQLRDRS